MVSFRGLLAAATLTVATFAQTQKIAFTSIPAIAETGSTYNITWGGGDGSAVTLTLRKGNPDDLSTVGIIADAITADYYLWRVSTTLTSANDYALQIVQGQDDINYSGLFSITAGSNSTSSGNSTMTATGNSTMSITSMASASGTGTAIARNSTFSTASLTSSSSHSSSTVASRTSAAATSATSVTSSNEGAIRSGSSAALILGIVAAVMLN